jgi:hypothetical protein
MHISNILKDGELVQNSVVMDYLTTATDGKEYRVAFYSLDMILAIEFRVRSKRGTQFQICANTTRTTPSIRLRNCLPRSNEKTLTVSCHASAATPNHAKRETEPTHLSISAPCTSQLLVAFVLQRLSPPRGLVLRVFAAIPIRHNQIHFCD